MARSGAQIPGLKPDLPVTAVAVRTLEHRLSPLVGLIDRVGGVKTPSASAVHALRVGCRRAGAGMLVYRELLPEPARDWWQRRLRKLRRAAGSIRTLDVLIRRVSAYHPESALIAEWTQERRERLEPFRRQLAKLPSGDRLAERQQELLSGVRWRSDVDEPTFAVWATTPLREAVEEFLTAEPQERGCFQALHDFRVAGKRLRYTLELLSPALGPAASAATPVVEELQSQLGVVQDRYDACRRLGAALEDLTTLTEVQTLVGVLHTESAALRHDLREFWQFWKANGAQMRQLRKVR